MTQVQKIKLKEVCDKINYGYTQSATRENTGLKFIRITDIVRDCFDWKEVPYCKINESDLKKYQLHDNEIVIARTGATTGESKYILNPPLSVFASYLIRLKINKKTDPLYVYYFLQSPEYKNYIHGVLGDKSAQPNANAKTLTNVEIFFTRLVIQRKISIILFNLDQKIECIFKSNAILEKIIQTIFKSWFVDFDGQTEFVDSELGEIPKGWKAVPIENLAEFVKGFSYKGIEKFQESRGFVFVTLNSIKEGGGFKKKYTWLESSRLKERHFVNEMDLIIANTEQTKDARLLATPAIVQFPFYYDKSIGVYSHHITKVKPKHADLKFYLYSFLLYKQREIANAYHTGTGVWGFDHNSFQEQYVTIKPSSEILKNFDQIGSNTHSQIVENEKKISILTSIRDSLLPKLMSGEIKVNNQV